MEVWLLESLKKWVGRRSCSFLAMKTKDVASLRSMKHTEKVRLKEGRREGGGELLVPERELKVPAVCRDLKLWVTQGSQKVKLKKQLLVSPN